MGRGSYTALDWANLRKSRNLVQESSVEKMFSQKKAKKEYDSSSVTVRQSCDSNDSPESTPVIIGFDVTSSMGYLAKELAVNALNRVIMALYDERPITNPHIMCAAIGDVKSDVNPLQVTQFEADIRIIKQLTELCLEGGGGGNGGESYNLLWYFAAKHTVSDSFTKRNKKGYIFTIGDDNCHSCLLEKEIFSAFGDRCEYPLSNEELLTMVSKTYHVFHIHIETDNSLDKDVFAGWQRLLPGCCTTVHRKEIECLPDIITSIVAIAEGTERNEVLKNMNQTKAEKISRSLAFIDNVKKNTGTILF